MAQARSRITRLRAPFVVTVAMGASACGGVAAREDPRDGAPSVESVPETHECPATQPVDGAPCNYSGSSCRYGFMGCESTFVTCQEHHWLAGLVRGGCNPPPPWCPDGPCPTEPPVNGGPCSIAVSTICSRTPTCSEPGYEAQCFLPGGFPLECSGTWVVTPHVMACNPPPPRILDAGVQVHDAVAMPIHDAVATTPIRDGDAGRD